MSQAVRSLARALAAHAEWLAITGVEDLPANPARSAAASVGPGVVPPGSGAASVGPGVVPPGSAAASVTSGVAPESAEAGDAPVAGGVVPHGSGEAVSEGGGRRDPAPAPVALVAGDLGALRSELGDCRRCRLAARRTQIVFGSGNPAARLVFVGEGPGRDEDRLGRPFVGRAGQLLTDIIQKGMRMDRSEVYICNVVKCRPPDNRNPAPEEVEACSPFLVRQIEIVRPEVIVALGKFAAQTLLETSTPITRLRGQWHEYRGIPLMPTFHPAHLLRNPGYKRQVWEDIKQVMKRLGRSQA